MDPKQWPRKPKRAARSNRLRWLPQQRRASDDRRRAAGADPPTVLISGTQGAQIGENNQQTNYQTTIGQVTHIHPPAQGAVPPQRARAAIVVSMIAAFAAFVTATLGQWNGKDMTVVWIVGVVLIVAIALLLHWTAPSGHSDDWTMVDSPARQRLIELTDRLWAQGALRHSLQEVVRLNIGLADEADAVRDPYGSSRLRDLGAGQDLPSGTRLSSLVDVSAGERLLIIGEPGSGKTTHLLELADDQIGAARAAETAPVPMVLLLSTWAKGEGGLASWICAEARQRYTINAAEMMRWLQEGKVLPLLDGLDEVGERWREECLADIEAFCSDPRFIACSLAVACRTNEFQAMQRRMPVTRAVRVLPLTAEQVRQVLADREPQTAVLARAVADDDTLAELLSTPLMLNIAMLAFAELPPGAALGAGDHRQKLFGVYVQQMLDRVRALRLTADETSTETPPDPEEMYFHLVWLARLMNRQHQTIFYPDMITPAWLPHRDPPWALPRTRGPVNRIAHLLGWDHTSTGLVGGRLATLVGALAAAPLGAVSNGVTGALIAAGAGGLLLGAGVALTFGVLFQSPTFERLFTPVVGHDTYEIYAATSWTWSSKHASRGLVTWLLFGGTVGLTLALTGADAAEAIAVAAVLGLGGVLSGGTVPNHEKPPVRPGGALDASLRRLALLLMVLLGAIVVGSATLAVLSLPWTAPIAALPVTTAFMLTAGPGRAWLRFRAAQYGARTSHLLPKDLVQFMARGEDRVLLRRAGGGYMFLHRDIQQYLAEREPDRPPTDRELLRQP